MSGTLCRSLATVVAWTALASAASADEAAPRWLLDFQVGFGGGGDQQSTTYTNTEPGFAYEDFGRDAFEGRGAWQVGVRLLGPEISRWKSLGMRPLGRFDVEGPLGGGATLVNTFSDGTGGTLTETITTDTVMLWSLGVGLEVPLRLSERFPVGLETSLSFGYDTAEISDEKTGSHPDLDPNFLPSRSTVQKNFPFLEPRVEATVALWRGQAIELHGVAGVAVRAYLSSRSFQPTPLISDVIVVDKSVGVTASAGLRIRFVDPFGPG